MKKYSRLKTARLYLHLETTSFICRQHVMLQSNFFHIFQQKDSQTGVTGLITVQPKFCAKALTWSMSVFREGVLAGSK